MPQKKRRLRSYAFMLACVAGAFHVLVLGRSQETAALRFEWSGESLSGRCVDARGEPATLPDGFGECASMRDGEYRIYHKYRDKSFRGSDLSGYRFRSADISGSDLSATNLTGAHLARTKAIGARLIGANLERIIAERAELARADLRNARFPFANLERADLRGADLRGADLRGASFKQSDLRGADLSSVIGFFQANFYDAKFDEHTRFPPPVQANLANLVLLQSMTWTSRLPVAQFYPTRSMRLWAETQSLVPEYTFSGEKCLNEAGIEGVNPSFFGDCGDLREVDVLGVGVDFSTMRRFRGAIFNGLDLRGKKLSGVHFEGAKLAGARFSDTDIWSGDFRGADLRGADFTGARLGGAPFVGADLRDARFTNADFVITQLQNADLRGTDFTGSKIMIMRMTAQGARFNSATRFPIRDSGESIPHQTLLHEGLIYDETPPVEVHLSEKRDEDDSTPVITQSEAWSDVVTDPLQGNTPPSDDMPPAASPQPAPSAQPIPSEGPPNAQPSALPMPG